MYSWVRRFITPVAATLALAGVVIGATAAAVSTESLPPRDLGPVPDRVAPFADATPIPTATATVTPTPTVTVAPTATPTLTPRPTLTAEPLSVTAVATPPPPTPTPQPTPAPAGASMDSFEKSVADYTNEVRAQHGLPPLSSNPNLTLSAQTYAEVMAVNDWFDHVGPDGSTHVTRAIDAGYTGWIYLGEVLYLGSSNDGAKKVVDAWIDSSVHVGLVLSAVPTEVGVGCYDLDGWMWCAEELGAR